MNEKPAPKKRAAVFIKAAFEASNSWQDVGENIPKSVPHIEADDQQQGAYRTASLRTNKQHLKD